MGELSNYINKAILPVNFKAVISYIIEKFPEDIEIVVAVGHRKETIIDYLSLAHPERKFTYVEIEKYVGPGRGPGDGLLTCRDYLKCPFILFTADTIVLEDILLPDQNWFGIAPVKETEPYCTVKIKNNLIYQLDDKIKTNNKFAFIGLAGVYDYEDLFSALERNNDIINGFKKLIEKKLIPIGFTWFDTGTLKNYLETNKNFSGGNKKFDFSKSNEFLYFIGDRVIKFFADENIVKNRCARARMLKGLCPEIEIQKNNFYAYKKVDGQALFNVLNVKMARNFFEWAKTNLWRSADITDQERKEFSNYCRDFYYNKTLKRISDFYEKTGIIDSHNNINGIATPPLKELLAKINWDNLCQGTPSNFHGDLHFDNILVSKNSDDSQKFILLDWRHDFGGSTKVGDLYYDLAKLYGSTLLSFELIKEGMFSCDISDQDIHYNFFIKHDLIEAKEEFVKFVEENNFDLKKIRLITALIFLNMSPLHNSPFDVMLYFLGKSMLHKEVNDI